MAWQLCHTFSWDESHGERLQASGVSEKAKMNEMRAKNGARIINQVEHVDVRKSNGVTDGIGYAIEAQLYR